MRTMDPIEAFDTLYKLAIDGGSEPVLFGGCAPLAREALRRSPAACPFSRMWFEAPLSGQATTHFNVRKFSGDADPQFLPKIDALAPLGHVAEKNYPPMLVVAGDPAAREWKCRAEENELLVSSIRACGHTNDIEYVRLPHVDHGFMRFPGYMYVQGFIRRYAPYPRVPRKASKGK